MITCSRCQKSLPESNFGQRGDGKRQYWCQRCHCEYMRTYQAQHRRYYTRLQAERKARKRSLILSAKAHPCADCGRNYPYYVMDFDHRPEEVKRFELSDLLQTGSCSIRVVLAEIAKCDVVCSNCHRERTQQRKLQARKAKGRVK